MVTGDCSRKPSGRSVVEQRMSPEHADGRCEEARASHQEIGRSNQKSCPREWFVGYIVHRHQPQASVVTPRPNTSIPIGVDRITAGITGDERNGTHLQTRCRVLRVHPMVRWCFCSDFRATIAPSRSIIVPSVLPSAKFATILRCVLLFVGHRSVATIVGVGVRHQSSRRRSVTFRVERAVNAKHQLGEPAGPAAKE
ncbi:hypothetical protein CA13_66520 [Planctomycetes bacterium CA13]|uniref:Uncharacterized protein n=1 Tax=Novipirellula herctigrandis TaxID=2527986 RepID=A0A5C5ZDE0_9BACT|nr:hypothetical protein CA13_66520 [Planctomycetes bacterium CA13]